MTSVVNYKNFDCDGTYSLTVPEKTKGRYFSYLSHSQGPVYIQTPTVILKKKFASGDKDLVFSIKQKKAGELVGFADKITGLEENIRRYITENSTKFFNGKRFSKDKIDSAFVSSITADQEFKVRVENSNSILIKDQLDRKVKLEDVEENTEVIAILHVEGISFRSNSMELRLNLQQMKIYVHEKLTDWCISVDDEDGEDDVVPPHDIEDEIKAIEEISIPSESAYVQDENVDYKLPEDEETEQNLSKTTDLVTFVPQNDDNLPLF